ncbi:hypothetical protein HCN44_010886 [Aphidius gifuensis]|uniref:Uncharacterized protein n=1 Tax=Aphidius gifuensis TaxID=684658 RepID=A0A835CRG3_APHGI|nr:hypothetical protein HCN44_010886 [Aphidius gifuensis]
MLKLLTALHDKLREVSLELYNLNLTKNDIQVCSNIIGSVVKLVVNIITHEVTNNSKKTSTIEDVKQNVRSLFHVFTTSFVEFNSDYKRIKIIQNQKEYIQPVEYHIVCAMKRRFNCSGTAIKRNGIITLKKRHCQPGNYEMRHEQNFFRDLYRSTTHTFELLQTVYNQVTTRHPNMERIYPFETMRDLMRSWRTNMTLPNVNTYQDIQQTIDMDQWASLRIYDEAAIRSTCIISNNQQAFVLGDPLFTENVPEITTLHVFTSSLVKPTCGNTQFVLFVTAVHQSYAFNFCWNLLNEVSQDLLQEILIFIKHEILHDVEPLNVLTNCD